MRRLVSAVPSGGYLEQREFGYTGRSVNDNDLLRKALRVPYTLLRTPLVVLDEQVVARYAPRGSVVQTAMARAIDLLDMVGERLIGEPSLPPAAAGGVAPAPLVPPAVATVADAGQVRPLPDEEREDVEQLAEDLLEAEEEQTFAGELADDELRRVQAELRAKHTVEERDEFR